MAQEPNDLDRAGECVLWAVKYLRAYLDAVDNPLDDDPIVHALSSLLVDLDRIGQCLLPPGEGWPEPKEGMGKVIPFIPKRA